MTDIPPDTGPVICEKSFLAFIPSDQSIELIHGKLSAVRKDTRLDSLHWCDPSDWFIRLYSIGSITRRGANNFLGLIQAMRFSKLPNIALSSLGNFPQLDSPILAAYGGVSFELESFHSQISKGCNALGYRNDNETFCPCIEFGKNLQQHVLFPINWEVDFSEVVLMAAFDAETITRYQVIDSDFISTLGADSRIG